jgi:uncharacterized membrane protein
MKIRTLVIVGVVIVAGMLAVSAWAWPQIPDDAQVPIHWGPSGEADGYGPKWVGLLGIPLVTTGIVALLAFIPRLEPRRHNLERSFTAYVAIGIAVTAFLAALHIAAVVAALGSEVSTSAVALIGAGALFVVIGNYMGKTRSNWFFGIRTPWTLSSERSWAQTHRLGGFVFIGVGALTIIATILLGPEAAVWAMVVGLGIGVAVLFGYSYITWRDDPARLGSEGPR